MEKKKYFIVSAEALPEVFVKVAEAKRMLQVGEASTVGQAAAMVGISRSAFYKYKDAVQPFQNMRAGHIITLYALLRDNPGVLRSWQADRYTIRQTQGKYERTAETGACKKSRIHRYAGFFAAFYPVTPA